ncbi:hypothetical protein KUG47_13045 [Falsochrobactrum sp. TDYN1]|uniref:Uncharacterized protein n=1 Tax=Falsochrobactrum tianjinense TaxID=2706015 RepID=A0A949UVL9_9HYPH|nr:hypothetical protein [Falsochrobactrum sp. TDYN1]MBV2144421.1 hypothetical protein [Falsochrobactrum sp. TDYN1]
MRAKLFSGGPKIKKQLSDEDQKIAEKLMGRTNARKLANPNLDRPFRYRPLVVMAEYYEVPPINGRYGPDLEGGWNVDLIEDGVKKTLVDRGDWEECRDKIRQLSAKGIPVKKFETDRMRENAAKSKADRLARKQSRKTLTINHLKGFRL